MPSKKDNSRVRRYEQASPDASLPETTARFLEQISRHIETCWGKERDTVFHEIVSEYAHIDLHIVEATEQPPFHTIITSGMSDRPMTVPEGAEECRFAELVISLPPTWPMDEESWKDERHWWPFRWLKQLARFPHEYGSWLFCEHTVPNDDPPMAFAPTTEFCCMLLASPVLCSDKGGCLVIDDAIKIYLHSLIPIYREEMDFALSRSSGELLDRLGEAGVTELLQIGRKNVCKSA
jgi:hypothetical protein